MPSTPITDWGQALLTSLATALALLLGAVPRIIGFIIILLIGWFIAGLIARAIAAVLRAVHFNDLAQRAGLSNFVSRMGAHTDASGVLAGLVKWFVRLIVLVVAFDNLGLPAVSQILQQFVVWLPNLFVALVIIVITGLLAKAASDLVRGAVSEAGFGNENVLASVASIVIWGFGIIVAVNQIGVASSLINILFMAFVGALALALGLSFGLGGRDTAGEIVRNWYQRGREAAPRLQQAASSAGQQARSQMGDGGATYRPATRAEERPQSGRPMARGANFESVEPNLRRHYESTYSRSGYAWDQYRQAYLYGYEMGADPRYQNRDWSQVEAEARRDWERRHPTSPWDQFREAVREGWQSLESQS